MYGPIRPLTKAMGSKRRDHGEGGENGGAADFIDRARNDLVGRCRRPEHRKCRWMFSTMTMASSTRMPMEKISANSETRLIVKPQAQEANSVAASVTTTAAPTTIGFAPPHRQR